MKVVAIIQARMGSTRLSGKVLKKINGKTMIEHIVDRVKSCNIVDDVIVATSELQDNIDLIKLLNDKKIKFFIGSENNVLDRFTKAGEAYNADIIVRITGDNPLTCPDIMKDLILSHIKTKSDYSTMENIPLGTGSEVVNLNTLIEINNMQIEDYHREHVTIYVKENREKFKVNILTCKKYSKEVDIRLTVDTKEDFELINEIYNTLYKDNQIISIEEVISFLEANKNLICINENIQQKER